jgi:hypothetical protein
MSNHLDRRTFLRGTGVALALPMLDAMQPAMAAGGDAPVRRFASIYVPNGVNWDYYTPEGEGAKWELPPSLRSLQPLKEQVSFISGLSHSPIFGNAHYGCDHFLTGASFHISNYQNTISLDQRLVEAFGEQTRFPSLELTGDHGSSLRYGRMTTLAWSRAGTPILAENDPRAVFERLFVDADANDVERKKLLLDRDKSILDRVLGQSKSLATKLDATDRAKLDEYLTSVREVERRIQRAEKWADVPKAKIDAEQVDLEADPDTRLDSYVQTMLDLMVLAFQTDTTRIATYVIAREGGGPGSASYKAIDVAEDHHKLSHHKGEKDALEKLRRIDTFHVDQLAYFLNRLHTIEDGQGTLLQNSAVLFGSGMSVGDNHDCTNLPILLAGGAGGKLRQGRHYNYQQEERPLSNLFVSLLNTFGVETGQFGTSDGELSEVTA